MENVLTAPLVLVADDTVPTTTMLQRVFEFEGYRVHCAHDGEAALQAARELLPDLILLDVMMPKMTGFEVLQELRQDPTTASIPTIMITAMGELQEVVQGLHLGADDYVRKPFHWRELLARAQSKMRARKLEDQLQRRTDELEALLQVSEKLNQHLEVNEVLELILRLTLQLLGGDAAVIYQLDSTGNVVDIRSEQLNPEINFTQLDHKEMLAQIAERLLPFMWNTETTWNKNLPNGLIAPLQYDEEDRIQTLLMLISNIPYDINHLQLLSGISRQASMALKNAELYRLKVNYAEHLEEMVEERTHELRSAQHMLIRSEKLASVGRLAASIAHEINNPLLPIQINLDDMLEDLSDNKAINPEEIIRTQESVERIRRIVNRLLEFAGNSHISASDGKLLDLNKLIQNVCDLISKSFEQQGQRIELDFADLPMIYGDKDGLEQVFINLALNASEAMDHDGVLAIKTEIDHDFVKITVNDNGSGIPKEIIEKMFEPFISTKEDGNGLGLFVSYGIIQSHKGSIEVSSRVGVGTTFTVRLPLHGDAANSAAPATSARKTKKRERSN